jgi:hypothetical protein
VRSSEGSGQRAPDSGLGAAFGREGRVRSAHPSVARCYHPFTGKSSTVTGRTPDSRWWLTADLASANVLVWVARFGRNAELTCEAHLFLPIATTV